MCGGGKEWGEFEEKIAEIKLKEKKEGGGRVGAYKLEHASCRHSIH